MTKKELLDSLNDHQRAYVDLELGDKVTNGDYMLASYHLVPAGKRNILQAACEVASESSTGTNFPVKTETPYARLLNALVYEVDQEAEMEKSHFHGDYLIGMEIFRIFSLILLEISSEWEM